MCGIYGYIGKKNACEEVYNGLKQLQYRGYDSCGIAYNENNEFVVKKALGNLSNLSVNDIKSNIAFGHTRWATNGEVSIRNAHPHKSYNNNITIVHNGIIKNAEQIKATLINKGISFYSETDTEVVANYIESDTVSIEENLKRLFNDLEGSFSLIVATNDKDIYLVKKFSPLNILKNKDGIYISSDISSLPSGELYSLKDNDIIKIKNNKIISVSGEIEYKSYQNQKQSLDLGNFKHYMLKEIYETPQAIKNTFLNLDKEYILNIFKQYNKFTLTGCGTAYHSCLIGEYYFNSIDISATSCLASNYDIKKPIEQHHLHIIVSQSGETADCIRVAEHIKEYNGKILLITNEPLSTLARMADYVISTSAKKEVAVASTKTYCCQVFLFIFVCKLLQDPKYELNINSLTSNLETYIKEIDIKTISQQISKESNLLLIGKDLDYLTLLEASLKIREIDYIYTIPMYAAELKHGTLSLVDDKANILVLNTSKQSNIIDNTINEIKSRKGNVYMFKAIDDNILNDYNPIYSIIPFQLLSYEIAINKNLNPDMPRNLAKSVTVE